MAFRHLALSWASSALPARTCLSVGPSGCWGGLSEELLAAPAVVAATAAVAAGLSAASAGSSEGSGG
eukprot:8926809-Alexandrium_andersonii.AAC.1